MRSFISFLLIASLSHHPPQILAFRDNKPDMNQRALPTVGIAPFSCREKLPWLRPHDLVWGIPPTIGRTLGNALRRNCRLKPPYHNHDLREIGFDRLDKSSPNLHLSKSTDSRVFHLRGKGGAYSFIYAASVMGSPHPPCAYHPVTCLVSDSVNTDNNISALFSFRRRPFRAWSQLDRSIANLWISLIASQPKHPSINEACLSP